MRPRVICGVDFGINECVRGLFEVCTFVLEV